MIRNGQRTNNLIVASTEVGRLYQGPQVGRKQRHIAIRSLSRTAAEDRLRPSRGLRKVSRRRRAGDINAVTRRGDPRCTVNTTSSEVGCLNEVAQVRGQQGDIAVIERL